MDGVVLIAPVLALAVVSGGGRRWCWWWRILLDYVFGYPKAWCLSDASMLDTSTRVTPTLSHRSALVMPTRVVVGNGHRLHTLLSSAIACVCERHCPFIPSLLPYILPATFDAWQVLSGGTWK